MVRCSRRDAISAPGSDWCLSKSRPETARSWERYRGAAIAICGLWSCKRLGSCWSGSRTGTEQPVTYYRTAAARARILQADATTPRVRQYLDKMIAHCERLVGKVEPGVSPGYYRRQASKTRMARNL